MTIILVADPPWRHNDRLGARGAEANYSSEGNPDGRSTLSLDDICRFPIPALARDCTLALWRVHPLAREAFNVAEAWGFEPVVVGELVWRKLTKHGKRHFGLGRRIRHEHEICQLFKRGKPTVADHSVRSCFDAMMPLDENGDRIHSAKPDEFYTLIERLFPGPTPETHVELFARRERPGWACYGNELRLRYPGDVPKWFRT